MEKLLTCLLVVVFNLLSARNFANAASIVPGLRIGKVHIGASRKAVHRKLGRPHSTSLSSNGFREDVWLGSKHSLPEMGKNFLRVTFQRGSARQIEVTSPTFLTSDGISASNNGRKIYPLFRKLGSPRATSIQNFGGIVYYYDNPYRGLAFTVYAPSGMDFGYLISSVIVHRRGTAVLHSKTRMGASGRGEPLSAPQVETGFMKVPRDY